MATWIDRVAEFKGLSPAFAGRSGSKIYGDQRSDAVACGDHAAAADCVTNVIVATKTTAGPPKCVATSPSCGSVEKVMAIDIDGLCSSSCNECISTGPTRVAVMWLLKLGVSIAARSQRSSLCRLLSAPAAASGFATTVVLPWAGMTVASFGAAATCDDTCDDSDPIGRALTRAGGSASDA